MAPLRVAFVIDQLEGPGGTELHLVDLLASIDRKRVEPFVVVLGLAAMAVRVEESDVPVQRLGIRRLAGPSGLSALTRLAKLLRQIGPQVVVTYHPSSDLLAPLAARGTSARVVSCRRDLGFTRERRHVLLQRPINYIVDGMIAVSCAVRDRVIEREGFAAERIEVIPNGCDAEVYRPVRSHVREELGLPPDAVVLGTLANFNPIKGYDVLLPAAMDVIARVPHAHFLLVGGGVGLAAARRAAEAASGRIRLPGLRSDVPEVLSAMDIFIQASHSEGFSNSILQAMACGRPVIATRVGGNPELVVESTGILVAPGLSATITDAALKLLGDPELRVRMGQAARARAIEGFSKTRMVRHYEEYLEHMGRPVPRETASVSKLEGRLRARSRLATT